MLVAAIACILCSINGVAADEPRVWRPKELKRAFGSEFGHQWWEVYAVAFTPDGKQVVSGGGDNRVYVWDAKTLAPITLTDRLSDTVQSVAVHPNGQQIAAGLADGSIRVFDFKENMLAEQHRLTGLERRVTALCYTAKGSRLVATVSDPGNTYIYDTNGPHPIEIRVLPGASGWEMDASDDGSVVAVAESNKLRVWQVSDTSHKLIAEKATSAFSVAVSNDGRMIATGGAAEQESLALWKVGDGKLTRTASWSPEVRGTVAALAFSPDGQWLASSTGYANNLHLWDLEDLPDTPVVLSGHRSKTFNLAFSSDSQTLASGSADYSVRLWDVDKAAEIPASKKANSSHSAWYTALWHYEGQWKTIGIWQTEAGPLGRAIINLENRSSPPLKMDYPNLNLGGNAYRRTRLIVSPDGSQIATLMLPKAATNTNAADANNFLLVESLESSDPKASPHALLSGAFTSFWWSRDGDQIATTSSDKIQIWNVAAGEVVKEVAVSGDLEALQFNSGGSIVAVVKRRGELGTYVHSVIHWQLGNEQARREHALPESTSAQQIIVSPNGHLIAFHSQDGTSRIYELNESGIQKQCELAAGDDYWLAAFSPDESLLAMTTWGGSNERIGLFSTETGRAVREWSPPGSMRNVKFSPDGEELAMQGMNGVTYILQVPPVEQSETRVHHSEASNDPTQEKTDSLRLEVKRAPEDTELRQKLELVLAEQATERNAFWAAVKKSPKGKHDPPFLRVADRLMRVARQAPGTAPARDAFAEICRMSDISGYVEHNRGLQRLRKEAADELLNRHFQDPMIARSVASICHHSKNPAQMARRFIQEHPADEVRGYATMTLARLYRAESKYRGLTESAKVAIGLYETVIERHGNLAWFEGGPTFREVAEKELKKLSPPQ